MAKQKIQRSISTYPGHSITVTMSTHDANRATSPQGFAESQSSYVTEPAPTKRKTVPGPSALSSGITAGFVYLPADAGRGDSYEGIMRAWARDMESLGNDMKRVIGTVRERYKNVG